MTLAATTAFVGPEAADVPPDVVAEVHPNVVRAKKDKDRV